MKKMLAVKLEIVNGGKIPILGSEDAACYDLVAREVIRQDDGYYKIKLGIKTEIPKGYHAKLFARSSITDTGWGLCNSVGIIDSDFRGEWQARFRRYDNSKDIIFPYKVGDRVAQFLIEKNIDFVLYEDELSETKRGEGGHGSTGK